MWFSDNRCRPYMFDFKFWLIKKICIYKITHLFYFPLKNIGPMDQWSFLKNKISFFKNMFIIENSLTFYQSDASCNIRHKTSDCTKNKSLLKIPPYTQWWPMIENLVLFKQSPTYEDKNIGAWRVILKRNSCFKICAWFTLLHMETTNHSCFKFV